MRTLILATASAIALGIAGASPLYAADATSGNPAPAAPSATSGMAQPATPSSGSTMQQASPSAMGNNQWSDKSSMTNSQSNNPDLANTSQSTSTNWPRVSRDEVQQVQQKLQQDGFYHGKIDGLVGPGTQQALRRYQQKNGLPATATLDPQTMDSLNGSAAGVGSSMPPGSANSGYATPSSNAGSTGMGNAGTNGMNNPPAAPAHQ